MRASTGALSDRLCRLCLGQALGSAIVPACLDSPEFWIMPEGHSCKECFSFSLVIRENCSSIACVCVYTPTPSFSLKQNYNFLANNGGLKELNILVWVPQGEENGPLCGPQGGEMVQCVRNARTDFWCQSAPAMRNQLKPCHISYHTCISYVVLCIAWIISLSSNRYK